MRTRNELAATFLVADQRAHSRNPYITQFFGQPTAFLRGPERLARSLDVPVVYVEMTRVERGRYQVNLEWLCEDPNATAEGEITERFARRLERQIRKTPEDWLWLHRRWRDRRAERAAGAVASGHDRASGWRSEPASRHASRAVRCSRVARPSRDAASPPHRRPRPRRQPPRRRPTRLRRSRPKPPAPPRRLRRPPRAPPPGASAPPAAPPAEPAISLEELGTRIKQTPALGTFSKLSLKNDLDDLVDGLRGYHARKEGDLDDLHQRYEALVLKLMALLEEDEPELALALGRSRERIWKRLLDPVEFAKLST